MRHHSFFANGVVAGYSTSNSNPNVNCNGDGNNLNCSGSGTTTGTTTPAKQVCYHVRGATFCLLLPDGRETVVNCESKFQERMAGREGNHRSCRVPIVDELEVEFHGDKAKFTSPVSLGGKKIASETYKILGMLAKSDEHNGPPQLAIGISVRIQKGEVNEKSQANDHVRISGPRVYFGSWRASAVRSDVHRRRPVQRLQELQVLQTLREGRREMRCLQEPSIRFTELD
jgi:hypothetical protein